MVDPLKYQRILKRHVRALVVLTVVGFVLGFLTAPGSSGAAGPVSGGTYIATHVLMQANKQSAFTLPQMSYFVTAGDVQTQVAEKLGGDPGRLARQVWSTPNATVGTLEISATDGDPDQAVRLADTFATELVDYLGVVGKRQSDSQRTALQARLDQLKAQIDAAGAPPSGSDPALIKTQKDAAVADYSATDKQLRALDADAAAPPLTTLQTATAIPVTPKELQDRLDRVRDVQSTAAASSKKSGTGSDAGVPATPSPVVKAGSSKTDNPIARGAIGGVIGLLLSVVYALIFSRLDPRIHTKEEAEDAFGRPVIAEIPRLTRGQQRENSVLSFDQPRSRTAEAFRSLRSSILFLGVGQVDPEGHTAGDLPATDPAEANSMKKVVLVTSPGPSEGKTTTIANLAAVFAEAGLSVLVINCDFRRPRIHQFLGGEANERKVVTSAIPGVQVLNHVIEDGAKANPAEVVAAQREVTKKAREMFDIILLDTAPLLTTNDASELINVSDIVLVVAKAGKTTFEGSDRAMEVLERFDAPVVGVALVGANESPTGRYYYYYRTGDPSVTAGGSDVNPLEMMRPAPPARTNGEDPSAGARAEAALAEVPARTNGNSRARGGDVHESEKSPG